MGLLDNARTLYSLFRANKLTPEIDQEDAISAIDQIFKDRRDAANEMNLGNDRRDGFMFFQGAYVGLLIMSKAYLHHLRTTAADQNITLPEKPSH